MYAQQVLLEQAFNIGTQVEWELGLFLSGVDPYADLSVAEVANSRTSLTDKLFWDADTLQNLEVSCGPLPSCAVGGWFISAVGSLDIVWSGTFLTPVVVSSDDVLVFALGTININIA